ncbi:MAG: hypothetical protein ACRDMW_08220 [Gaiellaceae bacterium]
MGFAATLDPVRAGRNYLFSVKERALEGSASLALGSHNVEAVVGNY